MTPDQPIETHVWLPIPPDEAFLLVTEPARLRRWLMVAGSIDMRVGGEVHIVVAPGAHAVGRVVEIEPGHRFVYTHGWLGDLDMPPESTTVEVTLDAEGEGTRVRLSHHGVPPAQSGMAEGWQDFMHRLARTAEGLPNGQDWPTELETATPAAVLESSLFALLSALRTADPEHRDTPTASTSFTVAEVAAHTQDNGRMLASVMGMPDAVTRSGDHGLEAPTADALWPALRHLEGLEPDAVLDLGGPVSVLTVVRFLSVEFLVHAWDVVHAIGETVDASPGLVEAVLANCRAVRDTTFFDPEMFAAPVETEQGASPLSQLLALTGRHADPTPTAAPSQSAS